MGSSTSRTQHELDDFPPEIRAEILRFRDQRGQSTLPPEAQGGSPTPAVAAGPAQGGSAKSQSPAQHVRPHDEGWAIIKEGSDRATRVLDTKSEAVEAAREIAKNQGARLVIHRQDGSVQETRDYA